MLKRAFVSALFFAAVFAASGVQPVFAQQGGSIPAAVTPFKFSFGNVSMPDYTSVDVAARFGESSFGFDNGGGVYPVAAGDHITGSARRFTFRSKCLKGIIE